MPGTGRMNATPDATGREGYLGDWAPEWRLVEGASPFRNTAMSNGWACMLDGVGGIWEMLRADANPNQ